MATEWKISIDILPKIEMYETGEIYLLSSLPPCVCGRKKSSACCCQFRLIKPVREIVLLEMDEFRGPVISTHRILNTQRDDGTRCYVSLGHRTQPYSGLDGHYVHKRWGRDYHKLQVHLWEMIGRRMVNERAVMIRNR